MAGSTRVRRRSHAGLVHLAIVVWGVVSLAAVLLALPVGAALTAVNGICAIVMRGTERKLFVALTIAGVLLCAALLLTLVAVRF
ncbi:hypothetical protein [Microbacterium sp. NPDC089695]|uniref:hypothetical protein n=1 Tax=Microbacterium sp. NPDC089695 TaxID=3364198 RepID=UPI003817B00D